VLTLIAGDAWSRTIADVSERELRSWLVSVGESKLESLVLARYTSCQPDLLQTRQLKVRLPLTLEHSISADNIEISVVGDALQLIVIDVRTNASFPAVISDTESPTGQLNLADFKSMTPRLGKHFDSIATHLAARGPDDSAKQLLKDQVTASVSAILAENLEQVPDVDFVFALPAPDGGKAPALQFCSGSTLAFETISEEAVPKSDGGRGAFLFSTSKVRPRSLEFLKDGAGIVLAYRPIEQHGAVSVASISVSGDDLTNQTLEFGRMEPKIVNGNPVVDGEMDWSVALANVKADGSIRNFCGGTVISNQWVVTAAHCRVNMDTIVVLLRKEINDTKGHVRKVKTVWRHIDFGKAANYDSDIALVQLQESTDAPVTSVTSQATASGVTVRVVGWGAPQVGAGSVERMHEVDLKIYKSHDCKQAYRLESNKVTDNMLCARDEEGNQRGDACQGDSGGGLFSGVSSNNFELIGIVSFGKSCANPIYPGVYTDVLKFEPWIDKVQAATTVVRESP
jgi:V8-like Glu-specific endopeptidase